MVLSWMLLGSFYREKKSLDPSEEPRFIESFVTSSGNKTHATYVRFPNALHNHNDCNDNSNEPSDVHKYHNLAKRIPSTSIDAILKSQETIAGDSESACELLVHRFYQHNKEACIRGIPKHEVFKRLDAPTTVAFQNSNRLTGRALARIDRFLHNNLGCHILAPVKDTSQFIRNNDPHLLKYFTYTDGQNRINYCVACPFEVLKHSLVAEMNSPTCKTLGLIDMHAAANV
jgi:hypothetical protein